MYFYDEFGQNVSQISLLPKSNLHHHYTQYHNFILLLCINIFIENSKKKKKKERVKMIFHRVKSNLKFTQYL